MLVNIVFWVVFINWAVFGYYYVISRQLDKINVPIIMWLLNGIFIELFICARGIEIF